MSGWLGKTIAVVAVGGVVAAGGGFLAFNHYNNKIEKIEISALTDRKTPTGTPEGTQVKEGIVSQVQSVTSKTQNILIVGSDTREGQGDGYGKVEGARADVTILMHVPAGGKQATLVSIPRDSYVDIPVCETQDGEVGGYKAKFNTAYAIGGPSCAVQATEDLSGLEIDHYVEVNFAGVINIVDALGGVDVYLPEAVNDKDSGLNLPAGVSKVDGEGALAFVRARKFDAQGDIGRIERQQQLLGTMLRQIKSSEVLLNPSKVNNLLNTVSSSVKTDSGLSATQMLQLASATNGLDLNNVKFVTLPTTDLDYRVDGASTVKLDEEVVKELFAAVQNDTPLPEKAKVSTGAGDGTIPTASK